MSRRSDYQLLREYVDGGSQAAFGELVGRHVNLVYTAAHRQVRDRHAAEDVAQAAFVVLAQKGPALPPGTLLSAWLLGVTRMVAKNWIKSESRRRRRELVAARERSQQMEPAAASNPPAPDRFSGETPRDAAPAGETAPHAMPEVDDVLDDAMARLSEGARRALVLRFFEGRSFREVGHELGVSEDAAKQRVFRALERLRTALGRNGVGISAPALALALAATAVLPAPQGLAATVAGAATSAGAAAQYALLIKGATAAVAWTKAATVTLVLTGSVLLVGAAGVALVRSGGVNGAGPAPGSSVAMSYPAPVARAPNVPPGFPAPPSPWVPPTPWEALRTPYEGGPVTGVVTLPDGSPAAGAEVMLAVASDPVAFYDVGLGGEDNDGTRSATTGPDGRFTLSPTERPAGLIVRSRRGYAAAPVPPVADSVGLKLTLRPWARVDGTVTVGGKPAAGAEVDLNAPPPPQGAEGWLSNRPRGVKADDAGRFVAEQLVPGEAWVSFTISSRGTAATSRFQKYRIGPGATTLALGGGGRPVTGRVDAAAAAAGCSGRLDPAPSNNGGSRASDRGVYLFQGDTDGTFRVEGVTPGAYVLTIYAGPAATGQASVEVPRPPAAKPDEPHDVGQVPLTVRQPLRAGDPLPPLAGTDLSGRPVALSDFRGRYVLLHPWRASDGASLLEAGWLKAIHDRFGRDGRLAVVGLNPDDPRDTAADAAGQAGMTWPQIRLGGPPPVDAPEGLLTKPLTHCLIDPDGKIAALGLDGPRAYGAVGKALPPPPQDPRVRVERGDRATTRAGTPFAQAPAPATDDAATGATFTLVDGRRDRVGGLAFLHDGAMPPNEDAPLQSFFLMPGTLAGRLKVDLGRPVAVAQVNTYSWHKDTRAPQVYTVWGSDGTAPAFNPAPWAGTDPASCGWTKIATVDTRPADGAAPGGRHAVSVAEPDGAALGTYRYLLFELFATETDDLWGHTFYGEIDVVEKK